MTEDPKPTPGLDEANSSERQFLENLLNQRANFALVVFGLALAGAATLNDRLSQVLVLFASMWLALLLALATSRAQWKLDIIFEDLVDEHPAKRTDKGTKPDNENFDRNRQLVPIGMWMVVRNSRRRLVGYWIPWSIVVMLLATTVMAGFGTLVRSHDRTVKLHDEVQANYTSLTRSLELMSSEVDRLAAELTALKDACGQVEKSGVQADDPKDAPEPE